MLETIYAIATLLGILASILLIVKPALKHLVKKTKTKKDDQLLEVAAEVAENIPKPIPIHNTPEAP